MLALHEGPSWAPLCLSLEESVERSDPTPGEPTDPSNSPSLGFLVCGRGTAVASSQDDCGDWVHAAEQGAGVDGLFLRGSAGTRARSRQRSDEVGGQRLCHRGSPAPGALAQLS